MKSTIKIVKFPNKGLVTPTRNWNFVTEEKKVLLETVEKMKEALKTKPEGIALAANQAGFNINMFILESTFAQQYSLPDVIINPTINPIGPRKVEGREGCLSFPNLFLNIKRHDIISCDFYDVDGNKRIVIVEDLPARVFQHECEHLEGKLFLQNIPKRERFQVIGKFKNNNF